MQAKVTQPKDNLMNHQTRLRRERHFDFITEIMSNEKLEPRRNLKTRLDLIKKGSNDPQRTTAKKRICISKL